MRKQLKELLLPLVIGTGSVLFVACGHSPESAASRGDKAFSAAPPSLKTNWDAVKVAIRSSEYAGALTNIQLLSVSPGLTAEQTAALQETGTALSDQMYAAANKGDTRAKAAIEELRKLRSR